MKTFSYRTHPHSLPTQAVQMSVEEYLAEVNRKKEGEPRVFHYTIDLVVCTACNNKITTNLIMVDDRIYCDDCSARYILPCCQELGVSY